MRAATFAFGAGLLATVNPCGFAMLPAFLGYYVGSDGPGTDPGERPLVARLAQGLAVGGTVGGGFAAVMVTAGLAVTAGLRPLVRVVPWAAVAVGAAMAVLGVAMVAGRQVGLPSTEWLRPGPGRSYPRMIVFGAAYAVASLSCTLAVLLAVVAQSLATATPLQAGAVLGAYGLGSATVITVLSLSAAMARGALARWMRRLLPAGPRLAGVLLAVSGLYLIAYWLPTLLGSRSNGPVRDLAAEASGRLTAVLDASRGLFAMLSLALLVVGLVLVGTRARRSARRQPSPQGQEITVDS